MTSTGIAKPTREAAARNAKDFRQDVTRVPVFGPGCAGGASGLSIAAPVARGRPGSNVLPVAAGARTSSFRTDRIRSSGIIATFLFDDGAAPPCLSMTENGAMTVAPVVRRIWPGTLGITGRDMDDEGPGVVFDRSIPDVARRIMTGAEDAASAAMGVAQDGFDRMLFHRGGAKVIEALEASPAPGRGALDPEREALRAHDGTGAPTGLFALDAARRAGRTGRMLLRAAGPGFAASFLPMALAA